MLYAISARCVARDLHKIAPGPFERTCLETVRDAVRRLYKSRIAPFNVIIITTTIIIIIIITFASTECFKQEQTG